MDKRPYREINAPARGLRHLIIGLVLFAILFFALIFLWAIIVSAPPAINDRAPALERFYGGEK